MVVLVLSREMSRTRSVGTHIVKFKIKLELAKLNGLKG